MTYRDQPTPGVPCSDAKRKGPLLTEGPFLFGAGTRSRTRDLLITNQLLYQLSYAGDIRQGAHYSCWAPAKQAISATFYWGQLDTSRIRTSSSP